jgi:rod shape-determining protein MreC
VAVRPRPRSARLLVVTLVAISLAVITLDYRGGQNGPLAGMGRGALTVIVPMQRAVDTVTRPVGNFFSGLAHLPSLAQRNRDLERENRDLRAAGQVNAYQGELYTKLTDLLALRSTLDPQAIPAVVTGSGVSNFEWTVTIDKGSAAGITENMPVVTGDQDGAMLVGRVAQVSTNASLVQLMIDRNFSVAGVLSDSHATGNLQGQGDEDMKMGLVDLGTPVSGNESVFTQGYCVADQPGLYPPGILIGQVSHTVPVSNAIEESVSVRPAADFSTLEFVLVLQARTSCS